MPGSGILEIFSRKFRLPHIQLAGLDVAFRDAKENILGKDYVFYITADCGTMGILTSAHHANAEVLKIRNGKVVG